MRLWSLHPSYLDVRGLVALWREALLAQAVLQGKTKGYTRHPARSIAVYLQLIHQEATSRGYNFDRRKIGRTPKAGSMSPLIPVTQGQLRYEWKHLRMKLSRRDPEWLQTIEKMTRRKEPSPIFRVIPGAVEAWEKRLV